MMENFPNLVKEKDTQVQEAQRISNKLDPKRPTLRDIKIKMAGLKDKEKILKAAREKQAVTCKGPPIRLSSGFSTEIFQARSMWDIQGDEKKGPTTKTTLLTNAII